MKNVVLNYENTNYYNFIQYQSKIWTNLVIRGFFFILTMFYIVEKY